MKTMKNILICLLALCSLSAFCIANAQSKNVADYAELISSDEAAALDEKIRVVKQNHGNKYDIAVAAVDYTAEMNDSEFEAESDDFYDYNGYGEGDDKSGVLLMIDLSGGEGRRHWHITTTGSAIPVFSDAGIGYIGDEIVPMLIDGDVYGAFNKFVEMCDDFITQHETKGEPYDSGNLPVSAKDIAICVAIALGGGLLIGFIVVMTMKGKLKSVRFRSGAEEYVRQGSMNVTSADDLYLYSTVSRTEIPRNNSGSSGSSTHTGSSGTTHGGGGGSF